MADQGSEKVQRLLEEGLVSSYREKLADKFGTDLSPEKTELAIERFRESIIADILNRPKDEEDEPPHPGETLSVILRRHRLSVTRGAKALGISRPTLSLILHGRQRITPLMALRIEMAFGDRMEDLMMLQLERDVYITRQLEEEIGVSKYRLRGKNKLITKYEEPKDDKEFIKKVLE